MAKLAVFSADITAREYRTIVGYSDTSVVITPLFIGTAAEHAEQGL